MDLAPEQLVEEDGPIGLLVPVGPVGDEIRGRQVWRYAFPDQEHDVSHTVYEPRRKQEAPDASPFTWDVAEVVTVDPAGLTVDLKRRAGDPHPEAIVPLPWFRARDQQARLYDIGEWVADHEISGPGPHRAARDLLLCQPPRAAQTAGAPLRSPDESDLEAARRLVMTLDETVLPIQGPPGSGKTYTGARMIRELLRNGQKVGITGTSHKVIGNLLRAVLDADDEPADVRPVQRGESIADPRRRARGSREHRPSTSGNGWTSGESNLAAGTAWLWSSEKMIGAVDVLFVDEAGQISLANVLAMSTATRSIVLLGDPQQLDQPMQGSHPPGADGSALAHVLAGAATISPDRGLFLETTWRLHPALCDFTSEVFYDGRLDPEGHLERQRLTLSGGLVDGVGPRLLDVPTAGADNESPVEAEAIAELARTLVRDGWWTDAAGVSTHLTWKDVLIVAPFNAQVGGDPAAPATRGHGSARSTSSRARRRRSASIR